MKNKKLICIIAILCIITCSSSFIFTACSLIDKIKSNNDNDKNKSDRLINGEWYDFSKLTAKDWEGEELTEEEWDKAFSAVQTCTFHQYKKSKSIEISYFKYNDTTKCAEYKSTSKYYEDFNEWQFYSKYNSEVYFYKDIVSYDYNGSIIEEWKRCKVEVEYYGSSILDRRFINNLPLFKFSDFTLKDGYYYAEYVGDAQFVGLPYMYPSISFSNIKISFENGKVKLISYDETKRDYYGRSETEEYIKVYSDYDNTEINLPTEYKFAMADELLG